MFNWETIFHLKRILKRLCHYKWKNWRKLLSSSGLKSLCTFLSCNKHPFENDFVAIFKKGTNWKFIFCWRKGNWCMSQLGIQKNFIPVFPVLSALKLPSCSLMVFIDINTYILTEDMSFKIFLKKKWCNCFWQLLLIY